MEDIKTQPVKRVAWNKGKKMSPESIRKMSQSLKGRIKTPEHLANIKKARVGYRHSEETRRKMSAGHKGQRAWNRGMKGLYSKEKSPRWKGGHESVWRKEALNRDNYTCQICFLEDKEIVIVDHIKSRRDSPHLHRELTNMITLCPNCHARKSKRNKEYWNHSAIKKNTITPSQKDPNIEPTNQAINNAGQNVIQQIV